MTDQEQEAIFAKHGWSVEKCDIDGLWVLKLHGKSEAWIKFMNTKQEVTLKMFLKKVGLWKD